MVMRGEAKGRWGPIGASAAMLLFACHAFAQTAAPTPRSQVYTCVDATGKRLTSDRSIAQCADRDQRVLNADGSLNRIEPPTLSAEEKADAETREREASAERVTRLDAMRRDRNLVQRFPNEAAHKAAREKALDDIRSAIKLSETRINALLVERKPLLDEAEFYLGKPMPTKLRGQLDANDAALSAQRSLTQNQQGEVIRIETAYDAELARLKKLWAGAAPGTVGSATASTATPKLADAQPTVNPVSSSAKAADSFRAVASGASAKPKSK